MTDLRLTRLSGLVLCPMELGHDVWRVGPTMIRFYAYRECLWVAASDAQPRREPGIAAACGGKRAKGCAYGRRRRRGFGLLALSRGGRKAA